MSDPFAIWAAAAGLSKQKTIRLTWPELADALDRVSGTDGTVPGEGEPQPYCEPCSRSANMRALGVLAVTRTVSGVAVCGLCVGLLPPSEGRRLRRVPGWTPGRRPR